MRSEASATAVLKEEVQLLGASVSTFDLSTCIPLALKRLFVRLADVQPLAVTPRP